MKKRLYEIACSFRAAIESAISDGDIRDNNMRRFPSGCCAYASDLLQKYLQEEQNISTYYVSGNYGAGWDAESHAWIETDDKTVIDITGDQYKYNENICFGDPVYVGSRNNGFHNRFVLDKRIPYRSMSDSIGNTQQRKIEEIYRSVIRHIEE